MMQPEPVIVSASPSPNAKVKEDSTAAAAATSTAAAVAALVDGMCVQSAALIRSLTCTANKILGAVYSPLITSLKSSTFGELFFLL